ncbi:MAG: N-acetylmuramidase domain-containing protein [Caldilineaceae bacterium]
MSFQHTTYNSTFLNQMRSVGEPHLPDPKFGVRMQPVAVAAGTPYWRIIGVHHLTPEENGSRHNAFVEVLDEQGNRVRNPNVKIGWTWEGRSEPDLTSPLDKRDEEPAGDVPIEKGMRLALWLTGDGMPSDRVANLHYEHDDEKTADGQTWNSFGHHSFYVVFQRATAAQSAVTGGGEGGNGHREEELREQKKTPPVEERRDGGTGQPDAGTDSGVTPEPGKLPSFFPEFIFGIHECAGGGEQYMVAAGRPGWVLELASVGLDGGSDNADFSKLHNLGLGVVVRLHNGYEPAGALPKPEHYAAFAQACAKFVGRSQGCHVWVIGNEPNHKSERPEGQFITPHNYADAYTRCRQAIRQLPGHADDLVLVAGPAPWNVETTYPDNPSGDWVQYFADTIAAIPPGQCDGFAIHTYTFDHDPTKISVDIHHGNPAFSHHRYEFRTYRDYMEAIPKRCRHLPVLITETDPTNPERGWNDGQNNGWVRNAYKEIADWNRNPANQPIQALCLYRWPDPQHHGQRQWSIADRGGVVDDFKGALSAEPAADYRVRLAKRTPITTIGERRMPTIPPIPNIFTNQHLINAFFFTAQTLGVVGDELMRKAGLDVQQLAADEATRLATYVGTRLNEMPNLRTDERALIASNLLRELRNARRWQGQVNAPSGLNLRDRPTDTDSTVLTTLGNGTPLDVLHENNGWLFVAADAETAGFVAAQFVARRAPTTGTPVGTVQPTPTGSGHFRGDPQAQSVSLAPPNDQQIALGAVAGPGAKNLAGIWNRYGGLLTLLANRLQIDPTVAVAVLAVESGGAAFAGDGRMIIRFENHLFYSDWGEQHQALFFQHFDFNREHNQSWLNHRWRPKADQPFQQMHSGDAGTQALEWRVLDFAASLDDTAAKRSISMGAPQILGRNHARIGYATVQEMFSAFVADERNHILGLFDFIRTDAALVDALRRGDYVAFARGYNGSGQAEHYGELIRKVTAGAKLLQESPALADFDPSTPEEAPLPEQLDADISFLPVPELPDRLVSVFEGVPDGTDRGQREQIATDPRLQAIHIKVLEAWAKHMEEGLANNTVMFSQVLKAFMRPYYMTIVMYTLLFLVGVGLFVAAAWLSNQAGKDLSVWLFGGLGVATFLAFFISRPLAALEENLLVITRLGVIYNTYWTRLLYMQDSSTIQADLEDATTDAITEIDKLTDKSTALAGKRPG